MYVIHKTDQVQGDIISSFQYLKRIYKHERNQLSTQEVGNKTKRNAFKLSRGDLG